MKTASVPGFVNKLTRPVTLALMLTVCSCGGTGSENAGDYLSPSELAEKSQLAKNGNGDAALVVADYYLWWQNDKATAITWLRIAAKDGNPKAKYGLGKLLAHSSDSLDRQESAKWLTEAAKDGYPPPAPNVKRLSRNSVGGNSYH